MMNTMASGACPAPPLPIAPLWSGFGALAQLPTCLKRFATAQNALLHSCRPNAGLSAEGAGYGLTARRGTEAEHGHPLRRHRGLQSTD